MLTADVIVTKVDCVTTLRSCLPCSVTPGKVAALQEEPIVGFGSSNERESNLPGIKPAGCPRPSNIAKVPG